MDAAKDVEKVEDQEWFLFLLLVPLALALAVLGCDLSMTNELISDHNWLVNYLPVLAFKVLKLVKQCTGSQA